MGMAASQARFLTLTARMSNNEYEAQQINQARIALADRTMEAATEYQKAMNNRIVLFDPLHQVYNDKNNYQRLTYDALVDPIEKGGMGMRLVDKNGRVIVPNLPEGVSEGTLEALNYLVDDKVLDANYLENGLREKGWNFQQPSQYSTKTEKGWTESELMARITAKDGEENKENILQIIQEFLEKMFAAKTSPNPNEQEPARIVDRAGKIIVTELPDEVKGKPEAANYRVVKEEEISGEDSVYEKISSGEWILEEIGDVKKTTVSEWTTTSWMTATGIFDVLDKSDDGAAEAKYTALTAKYEKQDKELELRLKHLDSEHSAMQTELDSVKKVLDKNVETTFKTFG